jgi:hypothetical protein
MIVEAVGDEQTVATPGWPAHPLPHGGGTTTILVVVEPGAGIVAVGEFDCDSGAGTVVATGGTAGGLVEATGGGTTDAAVGELTGTVTVTVYELEGSAEIAQLALGRHVGSAAGACPRFRRSR